MRQPDRLHLVHHALPHVPVEHWFSAYQLASVVYVGRGSPMPIQVKRIEAFLWQYVEVGQLDSREDRGVAPLFMRLAEPRPVTPLSEMLAGILHFHATRPLSTEDRRVLPLIQQEAADVGTPEPRSGGYDRQGRPIPITHARPPEPNLPPDPPDPPEPPDPPDQEGDPDDNWELPRTEDATFSICPPHLADFEADRTGWYPRAWRPAVDLALIHGWLERGRPLDDASPQDFRIGPRLLQLDAAFGRGGPNGYPVTWDFLEDTRRLIRDYRKLRDAYDELQRMGEGSGGGLWAHHPWQPDPAVLAVEDRYRRRRHWTPAASDDDASKEGARS